jgi:hypothetical protein
MSRAEMRTRGGVGVEIRQGVATAAVLSRSEVRVREEKGGT